MTAFDQTGQRIFPDTAIIDVDHCLICKAEEADDSAVVFRDDLWALEVLAGYEVPGWFVLRARRHALGWHDLTHAELQSFGRSARNAIDAVGTVFGSPATYLVNFGEAYPHFHCLITARGVDIPPQKRGGNLMSLREELRDPEVALSFVPTIREAHRAAAER